VDNAKEGEGVYKYADGSVYVGSFEGDMKNGYGKLTFPNGDYYEGDFLDGLFDGKGKYCTFLRELEGEFYQGFVDGIAQIKYFR